MSCLNEKFLQRSCCRLRKTQLHFSLQLLQLQQCQQQQQCYLFLRNRFLRSFLSFEVDEDPSKLCDWVAGRRERRGRGAEGTEGGPGEEVAEVWPRVALGAGSSCHSLGQAGHPPPRSPLRPHFVAITEGQRGAPRYRFKPLPQMIKPWNLHYRTP